MSPFPISEQVSTTTSQYLANGCSMDYKVSITASIEFFYPRKLIPKAIPNNFAIL